MGKSIIMSELTSDGYQELYPKTLGSQVEGSVAESNHSLNADKANVADLNWITLFENNYSIPAITKGSGYSFAIQENSFSASPLCDCALISILYTITGLQFYNKSGYGATSLDLKLPFLSCAGSNISNNYYGRWWSYPKFSVGYYGRLQTFRANILNTSIDYYTLYFGDVYSYRTVEISMDPDTFVNKYAVSYLSVSQDNA